MQIWHKAIFLVRMLDFNTSQGIQVFFSLSVEVAQKVLITIIIILKFFVRRRMLKITLNKFLWEVSDKYWAVTQAPTNYIRPRYRAAWNDCVLKASFQRKVFRKFLYLRGFICMRGRTSLKDANANCTWLNENRIAEETSGKIFSY